MKSNIHELPAFLDLAAELGGAEVQCQHMVAFVDSIREQALIYDRERCNRALVQARHRARVHGLRFYHPPLFDLPGAAPERAAHAPAAGDGTIYHSDDALSFERRTQPQVTDGLQLCTDPWRKIFIDWQGMVYPCCLWKESPLGDLKRQSLVEIWHSDRYQALRRGLTDGPLGPSCSTCSVITGGDVNLERSYFFADSASGP
jgi:radical SAM protein with 4Fe4S-binding SPASM domain